MKIGQYLLAEIPTNITKLKMAVTQVLDEQQRFQKKGKSSKFDAEDDDLVKSGPAVKV